VAVVALLTACGADDGGDADGSTGDSSIADDDAAAYCTDSGGTALAALGATQE
jgi:hypothetical protein